MPPLPREETKVVVRPRGGLCISKVGPSVVAEAIWGAAGLGLDERNADTMCPNPLQNIMVVSTPSQENVRRYVNVEAITVAGQDHEVSAYVAAPHATCKGVIRGIPLSDGPEAIDRKIVNARNPLALGAKRIKSTGVIIVVFDGYKVPNYVSYGGTLIKCTLYRKQVDVCYACGRLGHRSDVCPTPDASVCRACRQAIQQEEDHGRTEATGTGPHPSPRADYGDANEDQGSRKSNLTWADRVRSNDGEQPMQCDPPPEHARDAGGIAIEKGKRRA
ncbi:hypothetical protein MTO96_042383 [Rhipicephalus appendiculatus]